jgi:hypothetical protein
VISLDRNDKLWLDEKAKAESITTSEVVRRAIRKLRDEDEKANLARLLEATRGSWTEGDGLEYQIRIREEWDRGTT